MRGVRGAVVKRETAEVLLLVILLGLLGLAAGFYIATMELAR